MQGSNHIKALVCIVLLCACGCREEHRQRASSPPNSRDDTNIRDDHFASPEATFQAAKDAILKEDYEAFCNCWTPEGRDVLAAGMVFMGGMRKFFAEQEAKEAPPDESAEAERKAERITRLFEKHGLSEGTMPEIRLTEDEQHNRKEVLKLVEPIKDRTRFIVEMIELATELSDRPNPRLLHEDAKLVDLSVDGAKATGTIVQTREGDVLERPVTFAQTDDEWKIEVIKKLLN